MKLPQRTALPSGFGTRLGFWTVLLLGVFAWAPATYPGYWQGLEGFTPVFNVLQPGRLAGVAMAPDLWRGSGAATFLLTRPLLLLGADAVTAVRITFILCFILGGLGVYVWLRLRLGERAAGLAGLLYMLAPPFLATVYVRGSLSDALILGLLPLTFAGVAIYVETGAISAVGMILITLGWMWQTQAGLALFGSLLLFLYTLCVERNRLALWVVILSTAAALATLVSLLPMRAPPPVAFADHFVALYQLFRPTWAVAPSLPGWQDGYPFQLGLALLLFSLCALWLWCVKRPMIALASTKRLFWFGWLGVASCLLAATGGSAVVWQWSGASQLLTYPWQILLLTPLLLAITAGALPVADEQLAQTPYWTVLVVLTVFSSYPYLTADFTRYHPPATPVAVLGKNEIIVLAADLTENRQQQTATLAVIWQPITVINTDYNLFFQALQGDGNALTVTAQLDVQPLGANQPATSWRPGAILTNTYQLDLAAVAPTVALEYHFGYYDWHNGTRLLVDGGIDDKLVFYGK